jgi:molybdate/tungstate transport system substrate-binding protein
MQKKYAALIVVAIIVIFAIFLYQDIFPSKKKVLIVYSADAYVGEVNAFGSNFSSSGGDDISVKSAGSFALAQQISQGSPCDVFFSIARAAVQKQYLGNQYPGWAVAIASDQMVIAYSSSISSNQDATTLLRIYNSSGDKANSSNWKIIFEYLTSGKVKVGIANPATDPAGLRGWLVLEAAGYVYSSNQSYFVNRIILNKGNVTGDHAANLVAPLETGEIQFLFIYRSFAVSHKLHYITLDDKVNFGNLSLSSFYSKFSYTLPTGAQKGAPIVLYVTVPLSSANKENAYRFVVYVIEHNQIDSNFGMIPLIPPVIYNSTALPNQLTTILKNGIATLGGSL